MVLGATVLREPVASAAQLLAVSIKEPVDADGNVKVAQQGTANVNVVDTHEPFQRRLDFSLADGDPFGSEAFSIPAGKRFVAQFISVSLALPPNQTPLVSFNRGNLGAGGFVPLESQGVISISPGLFTRYAGAESILHYVDGGGSFTIALERASITGAGVDPPEGTAFLSANVAGYLVSE